MGKFHKYSKSQQDLLFIEFVEAMACLKSPTEMANFLKDLLSAPEVSMLARRLQIAKLLYEGLTYSEISHRLKVSYATIAKIQTWMQLYGEGYRMVLDRSKKSSAKISQGQPFNKIKNRYPAYFWPQLLLNEIVASANSRQKAKLLKIVQQMRQKTSLNTELTRLLNNQKKKN